MNKLLPLFVNGPRRIPAGPVVLSLAAALLLFLPGKALGDANGASTNQPVALGTATCVAPAAAAPFAGIFPQVRRILGNKTRMIQVALIFMVLGIAILMWGKK